MIREDDLFAEDEVEKRSNIVYLSTLTERNNAFMNFLKGLEPSHDINDSVSSLLGRSISDLMIDITELYDDYEDIIENAYVRDEDDEEDEDDDDDDDFNFGDNEKALSTEYMKVPHFLLLLIKLYIILPRVGAYILFACVREVM